MNSLKNSFMGPEKFVNREFNTSAFLNTTSYDDYFIRLSLLALSCYEWINLPETMNARFLERSLFYYGIAGIVDDPSYGIINTRLTPGGQLNIYEEPVEYQAYSINYNRMFNADEVGVVRNNILMYPTSYVVHRFAYTLYLINRTAEINLNSQKISTIITSPESQQLTYKNAMMKFEGGQPFIFANKNFDVNNIQVLKVDTKLIVNDLVVYKHDVLNEIYTFFGLKNANLDKKERVVSAEMDANNEIVDMSVANGLQTRQEACEFCNKNFGLNIDVKLRKYNMEDILRYINEPSIEGQGDDV